MIIGIVGSEEVKFTTETEQKAREIIRQLLTQPNVLGYCSGHCHLGGIDIWTEEIGDELAITSYVYPPRVLSWEGYKERNIKIATVSTEVHCITVKKLPHDYTGMRFSLCYHCKTSDHVKSGGCWTMKHAVKLGKKTQLHIID